MKKSQKTGNEAIKRIHFSDDESRFTWLSMLLDAYEIIDRGTDIAIKREKRKTRRMVACSEGCGACCRTHKDIPVYPLELAGIYWYAIEKMKDQLRAVLIGQLAKHEERPPCPFLIDNACSIYPVRPVACRQFIVFSKPCNEGEDAFHTRRGDVLIPIHDFTDRAFFIMLPFYGIYSEADRLQAISNRVLHCRARNLHECDWKSLAKKMEETNQIPSTKK